MDCDVSENLNAAGHGDRRHEPPTLPCCSPRAQGLLGFGSGAKRIRLPIDETVGGVPTPALSLASLGRRFVRVVEAPTSNSE